MRFGTIANHLLSSIKHDFEVTIEPRRQIKGGQGIAQGFMWYRVKGFLEIK